MNTATDSMQAVEQQTSAFSILWGVLIRPRTTFAAMRDVARGHWWLAAVLGVLALVVVTVATIPIQVEESQAALEAQMEQMEGLDEEQLAQIEQTQAIFSSAAVLAAIGTATGIVGLAIRYGTRAGVLFLLGLALGGQATFRQIWRMAVWSTLPLAIGSLVSAAAVIATGRIPTSGLTAIFTAAELAKVSPAVQALLARIDIWMIWSLGLAAVGMVATARISRGKAAIIAATVWVLGSGWAMTMAAIGQAVASTFGGA